jgi:WD40 repeat protein
VASGDYDEEQIHLTILDAATGKVIRRIHVPQLETPPDAEEGPYPPFTSDIVVTPDGSRVISAHYDSTVRFWDPESGKALGMVKGNVYGMAGLAISPSGRWIGVGRPDTKIAIIEMGSGKEVLSIAGHDSPARDVVFTRDGRHIVGNADLSPVLWSLIPKDLPTLEGSAADIWQSLASEDGARAYRLVWALSRNPKRAVQILADQVKPAELTIDRTTYDKWVANLDSPQFRVREAAERELLRASLKIPKAWLRQTFDDSKVDEVRARLGRVLAHRDRPDPNEWRLSRAVQALELAGSEDSRALLKTWAETGGSPLSVEAKAALARLGSP